MPDILNEQGLQVKTLAELRTDLETVFRSIYGADIKIASNSPDGQVIGIFSQMGIDIRELLAQIYNSLNPDRAVGRQLDERVVINNISRAGGLFTLLNISVTVDRTVNLQGLDASFNDINGVGYTVQDNGGNQFILVDSVTLTAGTHSLTFRAQRLGQVETVVNTINNPVTIVLGVTGVTNLSAPVTVGRDEETDAQLRMRRQRSTANASNGYLNGLEGAILDIEGVSDAKIYENRTSVTDANGIPQKSIWVVVEGGGNAEIAQLIYSKIGFGCDMKGVIEVNVPRPTGGMFVAKFDRPEAADLYVRFKIQRTNLTHSFLQDDIKADMVALLTYAIGQYAETSRVTAAAVSGIAAQGGGGVPVAVEISSDGTAWTDYLPSAGLEQKWTLDASRIEIDLV